MKKTLGIAHVGDLKAVSRIGLKPLIDLASHAFFTVIGWVMKLAPLGAFGAGACIIGQNGIDSLASYGKLIASC